MEEDGHAITSAPAHHMDLRSVALDELILAAVNVHFTPIHEAGLVETAARLLDKVFGDYELSEIRDCVSRLSDQAKLRRDRSGRFIPRRAGRSSLQMARAFQLALEAAETVSTYDPPYGLTAEYSSSRKALTHGLLSVEQEQEIARVAAAGNRAAINELVTSNTRLAWSQTRSFAHTTSGAMDREDYFQEACLGLIRAAEKFDPLRGFRFSTYGVAWLKQAVRRAEANFARVIRIPVHVYDDVRRVRAVIARHEWRVGLSPEPEEIGRSLEMPPTEVLRLLELSEPVLSLDAQPHLLARVDALDSSDADLPLSESDLLEILDACLTERERQVLRLRFGIGEARGHTLDEVGLRLGVTRERIRQIQSVALDQIRPRITQAYEAG